MHHTLSFSKQVSPMPWRHFMPNTTTPLTANTKEYLSHIGYKTNFINAFTNQRDQKLIGILVLISPIIASLLLFKTHIPALLLSIVWIAASLQVLGTIPHQNVHEKKYELAVTHWDNLDYSHQHQKSSPYAKLYTELKYYMIAAGISFVIALAAGPFYYTLPFCVCLALIAYKEYICKTCAQEVVAEADEWTQAQKDNAEKDDKN